MLPSMKTATLSRWLFSETMLASDRLDSVLPVGLELTFYFAQRPVDAGDDLIHLVPCDA